MGEIEGVLRELYRERLAGSLPREAFEERCQATIRQLEAACREIEAGVRAEGRGEPGDLVPERVEGRRAVLERLRGCELLLRAGIRAAQHLPVPAPEELLSEALFLVERGEGELAALNAQLQAGAHVPESGAPADRLALLCEQRLAGQLSAAEYQRAIEAFEQEVIGLLDLGREAFLRALAQLKSYDGTRAELLVQAAGLLERAVPAWQAVLARFLP